MNNRVINVYQKNVKGFLIKPPKFRLFPVTEGKWVSPISVSRVPLSTKPQALQREVEVSIRTLVSMFLSVQSLPSQRSTPNSERACTTQSCPRFTGSY